MEKYLWSAHYFFKGGGGVRFSAVAKTSGDVAEMLRRAVDPYRHKDIVRVEIIRAADGWCKVSET